MKNSVRRSAVGAGFLMAVMGVQTSVPAIAAEAPRSQARTSGNPADGLYMSIGDLEDAMNGSNPDMRKMIDRRDIASVQVVVPWGAMEKEKGKYQWGRIDAALRYLGDRHKKLYVQVQDRFFETTPEQAKLPDYVKKNGGVVETADDHPGSDPHAKGAMAAQWKRDVRKSFQNLLKAMADQFAGKLAGVNLPETSAQVPEEEQKRTGYTAEKYFEAERANMLYGKKVFSRNNGDTQFIQYANFWPMDKDEEARCADDETQCADEKRMEEIVKLAAEKKIGIGGPDILPDRYYPTQKSYQFIEKYKKQLPVVAMAVQEPTLKYEDPKNPGHPYTRERFTDFARDRLGASSIFWTVEADWLKKPAM
ncbi:hypothetical protein [Streptomyces celluloflavus]|uniref:hypothetical protein n=1 Tax=Streptomyces celluloflavus TaxID=58344 RepID=UPI00345F8817|nr:hypothetical protein OG717_34670 [Streptomyces celluloflavus]